MLLPYPRSTHTRRGHPRSVKLIIDGIGHSQYKIVSISRHRVAIRVSSNTENIRGKNVSEEKDEKGIQVSNKMVLEKVIFITQSPHPPLPRQHFFHKEKRMELFSGQKKTIQYPRYSTLEIFFREIPIDGYHLHYNHFLVG